MEGYLGEFPVDIATHPTFSKYTPRDWAMYYITMYGGCDGDHHKTWVIDQVARILQGTPVIVKEARWACGTKEYRVDTGEVSAAYKIWRSDLYEDSTYEDYDEGTPP